MKITVESAFAASRWSSAFRLHPNQAPPSQGFQRRTAESGMATLVVLILLGIMMLLVASNGRTLKNLKQEIKLLEKQHQQRAQGQLKLGSEASPDAPAPPASP